MPRVLSWPVRVAAALALSARAAGAQPAAERPYEYWDPTVVTPAGQASRVSEAPSTTFVITGDEVRRSGATSIPEILRRVPGVDVRRITATDGQLGLRGFAYEITDKILVLVDGRTVYVDFFGGTSWEMLPVSLVDVERIEVVLGPGASVYGNKAMLGTINVITRSAGDYPGAEARVDAGLPGDGRVGARWAAIRGAWRLRATGLARRLTPFASSTGDASAAGGATLSASYSPGASREASLEIGGVTGDTYMIPTQSEIHGFEAEIGYVRARGRLGLGGPGSPYGQVTLDMVWNGGAIRSDGFPRDPADRLRATYHTPYARLHHELRAQLAGVPMHARWGGEVRLNTLESNITSGERDLWNLAAFASDEAELGRWRLTAGLRVDRSTLTRVHVSPRLSAVWSPADGHQLRAAFNTGYNDAHLLHYFIDLPLEGVRLRSNVDLEAERVVYGELGWTGVLTGWSRAFATAFAYRLTDWISLDLRQATAAGVPYGNNDALEVFGGETGVEVAVGRTVSAYASYALVGPKDARVEPYGTNGHGSPQHKVGAGVRLDLPRGTYLTADAQLFGASRIARLPAPGEPPGRGLYVVTPLDRFVMVHARAGHAFPSGLDLSIAASNAADDRTRHFPGAERPELRGMATVAYYR